MILTLHNWIPLEIIGEHTWLPESPDPPGTMHVYCLVIISVFLSVSGRHPHSEGTIRTWKGTITILTVPALTGSEIGRRASLLQDCIDRFVLQVFTIIGESSGAGA